MCGSTAVAVVLAFALAPAAAAQASRGALATGTFAVTNVAVIPMTRDTIVTDATVLVRDGRIVRIEPSAAAKLPKGARRIDGRGKYLIPGLADMHVHLYSDEDTPDSVAPAELGVMIANGVTTARLMIGTPEHLALRREIQAGRMLGPQLWVASPQLTGQPTSNARVVTDSAAARDVVKALADTGYDFIKLTTDITVPVYEAVVAEAARNGIRVVGHVDPRVGVARALAAGQQIEHLDNYVESVLADSAPSRESVSDLGVFYPKRWPTIDYIDDRKVEQIAGATARARVWVTPTLTMFKEAFGLGQSDSLIRSRPDWRMMPAAERELYLGARNSYWAKAPSEARRMRWIGVRNRLVKAIADSGGGILAGSDTPEWFLGYGFTLHRELESLVAAGLTPWQALAAATRNPAEFLHALGEWGTVEPGKRADLVLIAGNPLEHIGNTARIEGVAVGGRWLARPELDRMIETAMRELGPHEREQP